MADKGFKLGDMLKKKKKKKCHLNILPFIVMKGFFQHQHFYFLILGNCHELYELYELVKVDIIL